jgi:hypothetical protein
MEKQSRGDFGSAEPTKGAQDANVFRAPIQHRNSSQRAPPSSTVSTFNAI